MRILDREETLFSVKCMIAAGLAYWSAAAAGLEHPWWAVTTVYIVSQRLSGAVLSKALFRSVGTVLGAAAAVILVPSLVNEPMVLSVALGLWLGVCVALGVLDRTARSYTFVLAGYTASIIGFASVEHPDATFQVGVVRVQEILIGILCGSLVHGAVFPRTVTGSLQARVKDALREATSRARSALRFGAAAATAADLRLAADMDALDKLAVHLPFDTARLAPSNRAVREFQDQLALLMPNLVTLEERMAELERQEGGVPDRLRPLLSDIVAWIDAPVSEREQAASLIAEARALAQPEPGEPPWREMLVLNLLARLETVIERFDRCRALEARILRPTWRDGLEELLSGSRDRALHRDPALAVGTGLATVVTITLICLFWTQTSWVDGALAATLAGITYGLCGPADRPAHEARDFLVGYGFGQIVALVFAFAVLPRVSEGAALAAVLAPPFLILGSMEARPFFSRYVRGARLAFPNTVGLEPRWDPNFVPFINHLIASWLGVAFATLVLWLVLSRDGRSTSIRLVRACTRSISQRLTGRGGATKVWLEQMLDRLNLLRARQDGAEGWASPQMTHALRGMRAGLVGGELRDLQAVAGPRERRCAASLLRALARHFDQLDPAQPGPPAPALLSAIDRTVAAYRREPNPEHRRQGLVILTSLRRNLFPSAPGYAEAAP